MTKQRELIKRLTKAAKTQGMTFTFERHGGNHDVYNLDGLTVTIPRHTEIGDRMAEVIYKQCEPKLGKRWWK